MISIITVNFHSQSWSDLQEKMIKKYSVLPYERIVIDNSGTNLGHGKALDIGIKKAKYKYIITLDIDCVPSKLGWDKDLLEEYERSNVKIMAGEGSELKPIRPCILFGEKEYLENLSFEAVMVKDDFALDVGIFLYFKTLHSGYKVTKLPVGEKAFTNTWCDTYYLNGKAIASHHWYGTRFEASKHDKIDNRTREDYFNSKKIFFFKANLDL